MFLAPVTFYLWHIEGCCQEVSLGILLQSAIYLFIKMIPVLIIQTCLPADSLPHFILVYLLVNCPNSTHITFRHMQCLFFTKDFVCESRLKSWTLFVISQKQLDAYVTRNYFLCFIQREIAFALQQCSWLLTGHRWQTWEVFMINPVTARTQCITSITHRETIIQSFPSLQLVACLPLTGECVRDANGKEKK